MSKQSRRTFLMQAAGAVAASSVLPRFARADVNSQIRMATVGFNGRGKSHIAGFKDQLVALCDCDSRVLNLTAAGFEKKHGRKLDKIADFRPRSIAMEQDYRWLAAHRPAPFAWQAQDLHASGAAGDATRASAELGQRLLDHGARAFCELLADVDKFDAGTLSGGPRDRDLSS